MGIHVFTNAVARHSFKKDKNHLVPSWIDETGESSAQSTARRAKRSPILAAVGIAVIGSGISVMRSGISVI